MIIESNLKKQFYSLDLIAGRISSQ